MDVVVEFVNLFLVLFPFCKPGDRLFVKIGEVVERAHPVCEVFLRFCQIFLVFGFPVDLFRINLPILVVHCICKGLLVFIQAVIVLLCCCLVSRCRFFNGCLFFIREGELFEFFVECDGSKGILEILLRICQIFLGIDRSHLSLVLQGFNLVLEILNLLGCLLLAKWLDTQGTQATCQRTRLHPGDFDQQRRLCGLRNARDYGQTSCRHLSPSKSA